MKRRILYLLSAAFLFGIVFMPLRDEAAPDWTLDVDPQNAVDGRAYPELSIAVGVLNATGETAARLRAQDFGIKEDDQPARPPDAVRLTGYTDEALAYRSRPVYISMILDINPALEPQQQVSIRRTACTFVSRFVVNRDGGDVFELWAPYSGDVEIEAHTTDSGKICNRIDNYTSVPNAAGRSVNDLLQFLLTRRAPTDSAANILVLVASRPVAPLNTLLASRLAQSTGRPLYVLGFLDRGDDQTWQYLGTIATRTWSGSQGIFDFTQATADRSESMNALVHEIFDRYKSRYVLDYSSVLPRSSREQTITIQVDDHKTIKPADKELPFVTDPSGRIVVDRVIAFLLTLLVAVPIAYWFVSGVWNFVELTQMRHYP